jgi:hypothetical protein
LVELQGVAEEKLMAAEFAILEAEREAEEAAFQVELQAIAAQAPCHDYETEYNAVVAEIQACLPPSFCTPRQSLAIRYLLCSFCKLTLK